MFILDTNTISYFMRGDPEVVPRLTALRPVDIAIPAVVEYELRYGLMRIPGAQALSRLAALEQLLTPIQRLPFDSECAVHAAAVRAGLEALGTPIGPHDTLIAATALRWRGTLVTRNVREFSRVAGLQWTSWHAAPALPA